MADPSQVTGATGPTDPVPTAAADTPEATGPASASATGDPEVVVDERPRPVQRWSALDLVRGAVGVAVALFGIVLAVTATDTLGGMQADLARVGGTAPRPRPHRGDRAGPGGRGRGPRRPGHRRGRHPSIPDARRHRRRVPARRRA